MPLSRLTYGVYLIHLMTIIVFYESKLSTRAYADLDFVSKYHLFLTFPATISFFMRLV